MYLDFGDNPQGGSQKASADAYTTAEFDTPGGLLDLVMGAFGPAPETGSSTDQPFARSNQLDGNRRLFAQEPTAQPESNVLVEFQLRDAMDASARVFGPQSPEYLGALESYFQRLVSTKDLTRASQILPTLKDLTVTLYGADSAISRRLLKRYDEALRDGNSETETDEQKRERLLQTRSITMQRLGAELLDPDSDSYIRAVADLAYTEHQLGDDRRAETLFRHALDALPQGDAGVQFDVLQQYARYLEDTGKTDPAIAEKLERARVQLEQYEKEIHSRFEKASNSEAISGQLSDESEGGQLRAVGDESGNAESGDTDGKQSGATDGEESGARVVRAKYDVNEEMKLQQRIKLIEELLGPQTEFNAYANFLLAECIRNDPNSGLRAETFYAHALQIQTEVLRRQPDSLIDNTELRNDILLSYGEFLEQNGLTERGQAMQREAKFGQQERLLSHAAASQIRLAPQAPETAVAVGNLGQFYAENGDFHKAKKAFDEAVWIMEHNHWQDASASISVLRAYSEHLKTSGQTSAFEEIQKRLRALEAKQ